MAVRTLARPDKLPTFVGESLATAAPPYDFEGVTLRYFPLKADFHTLANFCDDYLNVVPPEIAYFRPAMPFVMLMIVVTLRYLWRIYTVLRFGPPETEMELLLGGQDDSAEAMKRGTASNRNPSNRRCTMVVPAIARS